ncbi:hypothetical protein LTR78_008332 [Recurvomyces mirabilis]|uniref:non-specific serine/threonine protein kinase n=1 Tax=Recurvomyces mirabilis TaxID=574656 RepID=A0AAE0TR64_9PEZI|nr:hypothetical protein LTR78_008332 [Recurvomyces mirabilis]KAK5158541.1 hypothetical protein LTS14_003561 [Recurvomyces mirabilis]
MCTRAPPSGTNDEKVLYERLQLITTIHPGSASIRPVLDTFELVRKNGNVHVCLIHPPLQCTMFAFQRVGGRPVPLSEGLVKAAMRKLLKALDYLHTEADVIHCDVKLSNLMLQVEDEDVFRDFEQADENSSSPRKQVVRNVRSTHLDRFEDRERMHMALPSCAILGKPGQD